MVYNSLVQKMESDRYLLDLDMLETLSQRRADMAGQEQQDQEEESKLSPKLSRHSKEVPRKDHNSTLLALEDLEKDEAAGNGNSETESEGPAGSRGDELEITEVTDQEKEGTHSQVMDSQKAKAEPMQPKQLLEQLLLLGSQATQLPSPTNEETYGNLEEGTNGTVELRMQCYGEEDPYVVSPQERGNLARFLNVSSSSFSVFSNPLTYTGDSIRAVPICGSCLSWGRSGIYAFLGMFAY